MKNLKKINIIRTLMRHVFCLQPGIFSFRQTQTHSKIDVFYLQRANRSNGAIIDLKTYLNSS